MRVTFENDELASYSFKLRGWYAARFEWIFVRAISSPRIEMDHTGIRNASQILADLSAQYDKDHPAPSWKDYL